MKNKKQSNKDGSPKNECKEIYKSLQDSAEKWQSFVDNTNDNIIIIDNKHIIRLINRVIPNYVVDAVVGMSIHKYLPQDQYKILEKHVNKVFETGKPNHYEFFINVPKKGKMWWHTKAVLIKHEDEVKNVLLISTDITKQRKIESKLKNSEEKYRKLIELLPEIVFETDIKGNITYANKIAFKFFGYSKREFDEGINTIQTLDPKDRARSRKNMKRIIRGEEVGATKYTVVKKDGHTAPVVIHSAPIFNENKAVGIRGIMVDLSEFERTEKKYRTLFDSSPDGICEIDEDETKIISINRTMAKNFGYKPQDMIGKSFSDFLPKKIFDYRYKIGRKALDENKIQEFEDQRAGKYFYTTFAPIISNDGKKHLQIIAKDVTNQKKTERKYRILFESSRDAIMMLSPPTWKFIAGNTSALTMFDVKNNEKFTSFGPWELSPEFQPDGQLSYEKAKKMIEKSMKTGSAFFEWTHKKLGGKEFPATVLLTKIELEGRQLLQATVRDISKQKKIEKSLKNAKAELEERVRERTAELTKINEKLLESEKKYRLLFDFSPIGIGLTDIKGNILDGNPAMEEMTGYSIDELKSKDLFDTYANLNDLNRLKLEMQKKGKIRDLEIILKNKEGNKYYALLDVEKIDLSGQKGYITIQRNISKQKADEQEIIRTKNRLQNVIDSASEIILAVDGNNNLTTWNETAEDITRYKQEQVIGENLLKLKFVEKLKELEEYIKNIYGGYTGGFDLVLRTRLDSKRIFRVHGSIIGEREKKQGILFIGKDVTEETESHGKLLLGNSYLITDGKIKPSLDLFYGLIKTDYDGLLIMRDTLNKIQNILHSIDVDVVELSHEKIENVECVYDLNKLTAKIEEFTSNHSKSVVLFDRIDYLLINFSFEEIMVTLYKINDIISRSNAILLLRLNPLILERQQFMLIKEEFKSLPSKRVEDIELEDTLFDILLFVYEKNNQNIVVSYQKISREFAISKVTTGKRLGILSDKNLISIKMTGRKKLISITDSGKALLNMRNVV